MSDDIDGATPKVDVEAFVADYLASPKESRVGLIQEIATRCTPAELGQIRRAITAPSAKTKPLATPPSPQPLPSPVAVVLPPPDPVLAPLWQDRVEVAKAKAHVLDELEAKLAAKALFVKAGPMAPVAVPATGKLSPFELAMLARAKVKPIEAEPVQEPSAAPGPFALKMAKAAARDAERAQLVEALPKAAEAIKARLPGAAMPKAAVALPVEAQPPSVWIDPDADGDFASGPKSLRTTKTAIAKLGIHCQFDDFHKKFMVHGHPCMKGGAISESLDYMALMVRNEISKTFRLDVTKGLIMEALQIKCMERAFDPVLDYLTSLRWDGTPRLDRWLVNYCDAEDTEYARAVGRKVLVAAVRRVRVPGCKFDYLMVLEGPQGAGKSSALALLAGGAENFSDAPVLRLRDKEQQEATGGIWIYEIAELAGKHIDVEHVKQFLSKSVDAARAAYGHGRTDQRRRCVFVATTNNDQYLKDATGNRRFWPIKVGEQIDLDGLRDDRDQLWAEAAAAEASGEALVIPEALWAVAAEATEGRMEHDPWSDILEERLLVLEAAAASGKPLTTKLFCRGEDEKGPHWRVATSYLLDDVLGLPVMKQTQWQLKRLAAAMRRIGWDTRDNAMRFGAGGQRRGFAKLISWAEAGEA
jgi:predicted P-loop ATPase